MKAEDFLYMAKRKIHKRLGINKEYRIGRFKLTLPSDHQLDEFQRHYRLHNTALGEIARIAARKYPDLVAVDVGANIGDTAASLCRHMDIPVLCIEGHPAFVALLRHNLKQLPQCIEVAECLAGAPAGEIVVGHLKNHNGTATIMSEAPMAKGGRTIRIRPLPDILGDHPRFGRPRLVKIDTDGWDFNILLSSAGFIADVHPILYFEYMPYSQDDALAQSIEVIIKLQELGYDRFLVYDNFGNFVETIEADATERFRGMNRYLMSQRLFGRIAIHYYDIAAFVSNDADIAIELRNYHLALIDTRVRDAGSRQ
jgi:FkbM family methyltransferase